MSADRLESVDVPLRHYADIRGEIRTGDLLLCAGTSVMSRMIQRATASPWSHVAFIVGVDSIDRLIVLESVESIGVRAVPLSHYVRDYAGSGRGYAGRLLIARHAGFASVAPQRLRAMSRFAADLLGRRYDTAEILRIAGRIMHNALRIGGADDDDLDADRNAPTGSGSEGRGGGRAYICSEYVWECFQAASIDIAFDQRGFIAPADFAADPAVHALWQVAVER